MPSRLSPAVRIRRGLLALLVGAGVAIPAGPVAGLDTDLDGDNIPDEQDTVTSDGAIVSRGKPTAQSSTYNPATTPASDAVDGNYDGNGEGLNAITHRDGRTWWEVDLGQLHTIDAINVWNRTDGGPSIGARLDGAAVVISAVPFGDVSFDDARRHAVWSTVITDAGEVEQLAVPDRLGRYVRVQLPTDTWLQLAEVDVMGVVGRPNDLDADLIIDAEDTVANNGVIVSTGRPATQSSTWSGQPNTEASSAVDDIRDGGRDGSQPVAITDDDSPWWQVDLQGWFAIDGINLYNRTDAGQTLLSGATVMIATTPFAEDLTLPDAIAHADWHTVITEPLGLVQLDVPDASGRYVRIQHPDGATPHLGLAEVDVLASVSVGDVDGDQIPDSADIRYNAEASVARGRPAIQSSTYNPSTTPASDAVDGSYAGTTEGDNAITQNTPHRWWEVDLGANHAIDTINVWNRNSTSASVNARLDGAVVMISTEPFADVDVDIARLDAVWSATIVDAGRYEQFAMPNTVGRYVRIQLPADGSWLQLAEVDVFGVALEPIDEGSGPAADVDGDNIADHNDIATSAGALVSRGATATQSSSYRSTTPATDAVDGSYVGTSEGDNAITAYEAEAWWEVDLGDTYAIDSINVWNRNSTSAGVNARLDGAVVMISSSPFGDASLADATAAASWTGTIPDAGLVDQFAVPDVVGRYVRIQLPTSNWLQLAEVDVYGSATAE